MKYVIRIIASAIIFLTANLPVLGLYFGYSSWMVLTLVLFVVINAVPSLSNRSLPRKRLRLCADGCELLEMFLISMAVSAVYLLFMLPVLFPENKTTWFLGLLTVFLAEAVVFWNGIIRAYTTSAQIGVKWRVIGILCGWIPVANLAALAKIIHIASKETEFESQKIRVNEQRKQERICAVKYPILMVHGVVLVNLESCTCPPAFYDRQFYHLILDQA